MVCYLKAEVVAAGAPAAPEGPPGGEAAAAWAPGPAEHPSGAARLAACPRESLEGHLGEESGCRGVSRGMCFLHTYCTRSVLSLPHRC